MFVRKIPKSVWLAILMLVVMQGARLTFWVVIVMKGREPAHADLAELLRLAVAGLVIAGFVAGHRLTWQWGRILALLGAAGALVFTIASATAGGSGRPAVSAGTVAILLIQTVTLLVLFFSLGTRTAREHFRLICPACGASTQRAADFLFSRAKCDCGNVW